MIKKPLVLIDGEIAQLQSGDQLASNPNAFNAENGDAYSLPSCIPVYISAENIINYATSDEYPNAIGLAAEEIASNETGVVQTDGKMVAQTSEWDGVTGQTGGLTSGATYYLSSPGLTVTPPETGFLVRLGIAINPTSLEIKISRPIRL